MDFEVICKKKRDTTTSNVTQIINKTLKTKALEVSLAASLKGTKIRQRNLHKTAQE
jgi:hypothetical protein